MSLNEGITSHLNQLTEHRRRHEQMRARVRKRTGTVLSEVCINCTIEIMYEASDIEFERTLLGSLFEVLLKRDDALIDVVELITETQKQTIQKTQNSNKNRVCKDSVLGILNELEHKHGIVHLDTVFHRDKEILVICKLNKDKLQILNDMLLNRWAPHPVGGNEITKKRKNEGEVSMRLSQEKLSIEQILSTPTFKERQSREQTSELSELLDRQSWKEIKLAEGTILQTSNSRRLQECK
eukprot:TRINITY_DN3849_c0_g1_i22.p1 TRINITY_DN3849_c0_g1~~TRINITY_DN3849_c0_g1_i22.p1  ORF type:complete len:248 (-),score=45.81 TRINITY_DN3849_c0_g1_i22:1120-1836(-)